MTAGAARTIMRTASLALLVLCLAVACSSSNPNVELSERDLRKCLRPIERIPPEYPQHAVVEEIGGRVLIEATVTRLGQTKDVG